MEIKGPVAVDYPVDTNVSDTQIMTLLQHGRAGSSVAVADKILDGRFAHGLNANELDNGSHAIANGLQQIAKSSESITSSFLVNRAVPREGHANQARSEQLITLLRRTTTKRLRYSRLISVISDSANEAGLVITVVSYITVDVQICEAIVTTLDLNAGRLVPKRLFGELVLGEHNYNSDWMTISTSAAESVCVDGHSYSISHEKILNKSLTAMTWLEPTPDQGVANTVGKVSILVPGFYNTLKSWIEL